MNIIVLTNGDMTEIIEESRYKVFLSDVVGVSIV